MRLDFVICFTVIALDQISKLIVSSLLLPYEMFEKMLREVSYKTGYQLKQVSMSQQGKDHPILWNVPETDYLKFYIFEIV